MTAEQGIPNVPSKSNAIPVVGWAHDPDSPRPELILSEMDPLMDPHTYGSDWHKILAYADSPSHACGMLLACGLDYRAIAMTALKSAMDS